MQIGIIGLPNSTKTTIFNALTRSQVETAAYSTGQVETNTAMVAVPDPRVDRLAPCSARARRPTPRSSTTTSPACASGIGQEGGLSGPLLNAVAQNDAFLHVVRAFEDEDVPHPAGQRRPGPRPGGDGL